MDAARWAVKKFGAKLNVIKKNSPEYVSEKDPPPCPSVMVNGNFIAKNDMVTIDALNDAIQGIEEPGDVRESSISPT